MRPDLLYSDVMLNHRSQRLMHESIKEQEKAAKAGLEYLQVQANKETLEAECKGIVDEIAVAQANFVESTCQLIPELSLHAQSHLTVWFPQSTSGSWRSRRTHGRSSGSARTSSRSAMMRSEGSSSRWRRSVVVAMSWMEDSGWLTLLADRLATSRAKAQRSGRRSSRRVRRSST